MKWKLQSFLAVLLATLLFDEILGESMPEKKSDTGNDDTVTTCETTEEVFAPLSERPNEFVPS